MGTATFKKQERLYLKKEISTLFEKGKIIHAFPVNLLFHEIELPDSPHVKVMFSVSKKNFKKAVTRNKIKRQMREIYRKHKMDFFNPENSRFRGFILFMFTGKTLITFDELKGKILLLLQRLKNLYDQPD